MANSDSEMSIVDGPAATRATGGRIVVLEQPDDTDHEQRPDERDEQRCHAEEHQAAERAPAVGAVGFGGLRWRGLFDDGHVSSPVVAVPARSLPPAIASP